MPISRPWRYLPFISAINFMATHNPNEPGAFKGVFLHLTYGFVGSISFIVYAMSSIDTGTINPFEQKRVSDKRAIEYEKSQENLAQKLLKYDELYKKVFGPSGYADTNLDTGISFSERVAAYRKMGYDSVLFEGGSFPTPTIEQLEELVKLYEGGK